MDPEEPTEVIFKAEDGRTLWSKTVTPPSFERVGRNGLGHLPGYVARLLQSRARAAYLYLSILNTPHLLTLAMSGNRIMVILHADWEQESAQERAILEFFVRRGIEPLLDYRWNQADLPLSQRTLVYGLPNEGEQVLTLCTQMLRELYAVDEEMGIAFSYEEVHTPSPDRTVLEAMAVMSASSGPRCLSGIGDTETSPADAEDSDGLR